MGRNRLIAPSHDDEEVLDSAQLDKLESSFRHWAARPARTRGPMSRSRILLIFLFIRYTGAKLSEVLALEPEYDVDLPGRSVVFRNSEEDRGAREVSISENLAREIGELLHRAEYLSGRFFAIDPAYVRRKFYERAEECGFDKSRGGPEMIRKARAVELMRNNMPLPAVQRLLGHSTPNLAYSYVSFSDQDMREAARLYMERESKRKTSARNSFFCKVRSLAKGDVQTLVELAAMDGGTLTTIITNTSAERMGLRPSLAVTAEIKAPWLILERSDRPGAASAENRREGVIARITRGGINTECAVKLPDGTELCSILSTSGFDGLNLKEGDPVRVLFNAYAIILQAE